MAGQAKSHHPSIHRPVNNGIMAFRPVPADSDYIDKARLMHGEMRRLPLLDATGVAVHDVHGDVGVVQS